MPEEINELYITIDKPYFVISGLELDVEFDYISAEEKQQAITELTQIVQEQKIESRIGESEIHPEDIIFVPGDNSIEYAETYFYYMQVALTQ